MGVAKRVALAIFAAGLASPALASVLPLMGAIGNEAGCRFFVTGEAASGMAVVTGDTLTSPAGGCDFVERLPASEGDGLLLAHAVCDGIGEIHDGLDEVLVELQGDAGFFAFIEGTEVAGPLAPCPGVEELMSPGVRI